MKYNVKKNIQSHGLLKEVLHSINISFSSIFIAFPHKGLLDCLMTFIAMLKKYKIPDENTIFKLYNA